MLRSLQLLQIVPGYSHSHGCFFYSHTIHQYHLLRGVDAEMDEGGGGKGGGGGAHIELGLVQLCTVHSAHIFFFGRV